MMNLTRLIILGTLLLVATQSFAAEHLSVYTVNYPLAYFAERIGGDQVEVVFPAPADVDPAYWMPNQETITAYQRADLILLNGANYAKWVDKVSLSRSKMVDTSRSFRDRYLYASEVTTHSHGAVGAHAHESLAFTTWIDLSLAKLQAESIYKALARKRPTSEVEFHRNFLVLAEDLERLHARIKEVVSKDPDRALLGSHPVYDYLSTGYGINLKSVHWEPNEVPTISQWNGLNQVLKERLAKDMLWEEEPLPGTVATLVDKGIDSVVFSPLGNRPNVGDFMSIMLQNIANLEKVYK